jgi:hypothetical protein
LWAERFGSSKALTNGDILNLVPVITLSTEWFIFKNSNIKKTSYYDVFFFVYLP